MANLIVVKCDGCGRLEVVDEISQNEVVARRSILTNCDGHHVIPDDHNTDWICYGNPVVVPRPELVVAVIQRGPGALEQHQPTRRELEDLGATKSVGHRSVLGVNK